MWYRTLVSFVIMKKSPSIHQKHTKGKIHELERIAPNKSGHNLITELYMSIVLKPTAARF